MKKLEYTHHEGVTCAKSSINILGKKMDVCAFYVDGLLIETGPSRASKSFKRFFEDKKINKAVITHHHEDHTGNAFMLNQKNIKLYANKKSLKYLANSPSLPLYRKVFWGKRPEFKAKEHSATIELLSTTLEALNTPGHSPDHVSFYSPERGVIFSGDVYVSEKTKVLYESQNIHQTMKDIKKLLGYDFDTLFCSHAGIIKQGKKVLDRKLNNLEEEKEKILNLYKDGLTVEEIDRLLYKGSRFISIVSRYEMSSKNLVKSVIFDK